MTGNRFLRGQKVCSTPSELVYLPHKYIIVVDVGGGVGAHTLTVARYALLSDLGDSLQLNHQEVFSSEICCSRSRRGSFRWRKGELF
jgi:hypothetical protein